MHLIGKMGEENVIVSMTPLEFNAVIVLGGIDLSMAALGDAGSVVRDAAPKSAAEEPAADRPAPQPPPRKTRPARRSPVRTAIPEKSEAICKQCNQPFKRSNAARQDFCNDACRKKFARAYNRKWAAQRRAQAKTPAAGSRPATPDQDAKARRLEMIKAAVAKTSGGGM